MYMGCSSLRLDIDFLSGPTRPTTATACVPEHTSAANAHGSTQQHSQKCNSLECEHEIRIEGEEGEGQFAVGNLEEPLSNQRR